MNHIRVNLLLVRMLLAEPWFYKQVNIDGPLPPAGLLGPVHLRTTE